MTTIVFGYFAESEFVRRRIEILYDSIRLYCEIYFHW